MRPSLRCTKTHKHAGQLVEFQPLNPLKHSGVPCALTINRFALYTQRYVFGVILKTSIDFVTKVYQLTGRCDTDRFCKLEEKLLHTDITQKEHFSISICKSTTS
jgi:hypothetical protein